MQIAGLEFPDEVLDSIQADRRPGKLRADLKWKIEQDAREYEPQLETILRHLPLHIAHGAPGTTMVDIGCGRGMKAVLLALEIKPSRLILVDGDGSGRKRRNYNEDTEAWADVRVAGALADANGLGSITEIYTPDGLPWHIVNADLIISQLSWGHHYPIENYVDWVSKSLKPDGRIITDIRTSTDGLAVLERWGFMSISALEIRPKRTRYILRRQANVGA